MNGRFLKRRGKELSVVDRRTEVVGWLMALVRFED
jgi:hypothetical protein